MVRMYRDVEVVSKRGCWRGRRGEEEKGRGEGASKSFYIGHRRYWTDHMCSSFTYRKYAIGYKLDLFVCLIPDTCIPII